MAITEKLNEEWGRNLTADALFEFRAVCQNFYNIAQETSTKILEIQQRAEFGSVDAELKQEGVAVRDIINACKTDLDAHTDFLEWEQP